MSEKKFLRHRINGRVYPYMATLAENADMEPISEEQAYPERFKPKRAAKRKPKLNLDTENIPEAPVEGSDELSAEASKGTP